MFVAMIVLDERRVSANRKDCCICCVRKGGAENSRLARASSPGAQGSRKHAASRVMTWYGKQLMNPVAKGLILALFAGFFGFCAYQTTMLTQAFDVKELLPDGSYATEALIAMDDYQKKTVAISITFRDVDQSDPFIQGQMLQFIEDVASLEPFGEEPPFCWVRDFQKLKETGHYDAFANLTFNQQVDFALSVPAIREVYGDDIVLDDEGDILSSRCWILATNTYLDHVNTTIELLLDQRVVSDEQPINEGREREAFFTYSHIYLIWVRNACWSHGR